MYELVYTSVARRPLNPVELADLLQRARASNAKLGITGLLLYHGSSFLQVLEGPREQVQTLIERIGRDPRHQRLSLLREGPIEQRQFSAWTMGFVTLDGALLRELKGRHALLSNGSLQGQPADLLKLLDDFREGGARDHLYV